MGGMAAKTLLLRRSPVLYLTVQLLTFQYFVANVSLFQELACNGQAALANEKIRVITNVIYINQFVIA